MKRTFDHLARCYHGLELLLFQGALKRTRFEQLSALAGCDRILLLGEGDGRFVVELLKRFPNAQITIVERSPSMLDQCRKRLAKLPYKTGAGSSSNDGAACDVQLVNADVSTWLQADPKTSWDAIVTVFFLDCFESAELSHIVTELSARLRSGGLWLYADFCQTQHGLGRYFARALIALLYAFFAALTDIRARRLVDPRPFFSATNLTQTTQHHNLGGVLVSEVWYKGESPQEQADGSRRAPASSRNPRPFANNASL